MLSAAYPELMGKVWGTGVSLEPNTCRLIKGPIFNCLYTLFRRQRISDGDRINVSSIISASYSGLVGSPLATNHPLGSWITISGTTMHMGVPLANAANNIGWTY